MKTVLANKSFRLFVFLGGFFVANALVAEFIGVKIFSLEGTLGWQPLFGKDAPYMFSAGTILWPIVFIMTDLINEYYGVRGVKILSYMAAVLISYAFIMVYLAIRMAPADFWITQNQATGVDNMQVAFANVYGQSNWIVVGSLVAFLIGQVVDAYVFQRIRKWLGEQKVWLRATLSTLVSQLFDSFIVLYIAFVLGPAKWSMDLFFQIGSNNYVYKVLMAILLLPLLYFVRFLINKYLGDKLSEQLQQQALENS
jgi:queuosine precursor transporter